MFRSFAPLLRSRSFVAAAALGLGLSQSSRMLFASDDASAKGAPVALSNSEWRPFKLVDKKQVSHDTYTYRFALPSADHVTGLRTSACLGASYEPADGGERVIRPYTPITHPSVTGTFELIVKTYPNGKMGNHLKDLKVGDAVDFKGPWMKIEHVPNKIRNLTLLAGGTGITPMLQILQEISRNPNDNTHVKLVYMSRTKDDAFMLSELEELVRSDLRHRFELIPRFDDKDGYLTKDSLRGLLPPAPTEEVEKAAAASGVTLPLDMVYVCGPPPMMKAVSGEKVSPSDQGELTGLLKDLGWTKDRVYKF